MQTIAKFLAERLFSISIAIRKRLQALEVSNRLIHLFPLLVAKRLNALEK